MKHGRKGPAERVRCVRRPRPRQRREAGGGEARSGRVPHPSPPHAPPTGGRERRGARGQSEKSGPIRQECPSLVWRGLGPARESATSPHRSGHTARRPLGAGGGGAGGQATPAGGGGAGGRTPATRGQTGPGRRDRGGPHVEGDPRRPLHATLGCRKARGGPARPRPPSRPRDAWMPQEPARGAAQCHPEDGSRASGGGQEPARGARTHALRDPAPAQTHHRRTACPHLSGGTKCRPQAKNITASVDEGALHGPPRPPPK